MKLSDYIYSQINFNLLFNPSNINSNEYEIRGKELFVEIEGMGKLNINHPKSPKLIFPFYENDSIQELKEFCKTFEINNSKIEEEEYFEFPKTYGFGFVHTAIRIYKSELEIIKGILNEHIEDQIQIELDLFKQSFYTSLSSSEKTAVSFKELKESYIEKWSDYLIGKWIYHSPKEIEEVKDEYGGAPVSNPSIYGPKYWIDEINQSLIKGAGIFRTFLFSKSEKVVSTIALRRAIKWLSNLKEEKEENDFVKLAEELNSKKYTKECTSKALEDFFSTELIKMEVKLNWTAKRGLSINRTPLFQLIGIVKNDWLLDTSVLFERILTNVNFDGVKGKKSNLKSSYSKWFSKYIKEPEIELNKLLSILESLKNE